MYSFHEKMLIEHYLRQSTFLHLYELGDLDDFFWHQTSWYGDITGDSIVQLALLYAIPPYPVLIALTDRTEGMRDLLHALQPVLPHRFHAHLSEDVAGVFADHYRLTFFGLHYKMALTNPALLAHINTSGVEQLGPHQAEEIQALYQTSYPDNSFDARMLESGHFYGMRHHGELISIAGIHAYSATYRVAAIGNVTTRPDMRGRGLGTQVCAKLCQQLLRTTDHIGLNVKADNVAALASYQKLGFTYHANYEEYDIEYTSH